MFSSILTNRCFIMSHGSISKAFSPPIQLCTSVWFLLGSYILRPFDLIVIWSIHVALSIRFWCYIFSLVIWLCRTVYVQGCTVKVIILPATKTMTMDMCAMKQGGVLILEPQPWSSYVRKFRVSEVTAHPTVTICEPTKKTESAVLFWLIFCLSTQMWGWYWHVSLSNAFWRWDWWL